MHRHPIRLLSVLALTVFALAACGQGKQEAKPAAAPEVVVMTMQPRTVTLTTELPGRTSAHLVSEVRPQVGGIVQSRLFVEGAEVKAGSVLYQIDPSTYQAAFDNAKANLVRTEANVVPVRLKAERYAALFNSGAISRQDNDDAQAAWKQAEAEVVAAKAAVDSARIDLGHTRVTAPISGRIGKSTVTPGALVTTNQATALATIQQIDPVYVDITQSSAEVLRLRKELESGKLRKSADGGARLSLLLDDGTPYDKEGTVQFTDITVDQSTGEVTLRAVFPNPAHELLPGQYVRTVLTEGVDDAAILAPQMAVTRDPKGNPQVMVVKADDTVEVRPITTGKAISDTWLVLSGLKSGERIVVDGIQKVRGGSKVKAVEAAQVGQNATQANATGGAPEQKQP